MTSTCAPSETHCCWRMYVRFAGIRFSFFFGIALGGCGCDDVLANTQHLATGGSGRRIAKGTRIGNQAFNSLKRFLDKQKTKGCDCCTCAVQSWSSPLDWNGMGLFSVSRRGRVSKAEFATKDGVLDDKTRILLFKLLNNGHLQSVGGVLKTGKEGNIFLATGWKYVVCCSMFCFTWAPFSCCAAPYVRCG